MGQLEDQFNSHVDEWLERSDSDLARLRRAEIRNYQDVWDIDEDNQKLRSDLNNGRSIEIANEVDLKVYLTGSAGENDWSGRCGDTPGVIENNDAAIRRDGQSAVGATSSEVKSLETAEQRQDRRLMWVRQNGADHNGHHMTGKRGVLAELARREAAEGRPMSNEKDVRNDLKKAISREQASGQQPRKGRSPFDL